MVFGVFPLGNVVAMAPSYVLFKGVDGLLHLPDWIRSLRAVKKVVPPWLWTRLRLLRLRRRQPFSIRSRLLPKLERDWKRVDVESPPPRRFIT